MKWKVSFIAERELINVPDGEDFYGYKLGPSDYELKESEVFHIANVGNIYFFMYFAVNQAQVLQVYDWNEFRGAGKTVRDCYLDTLARVATGIGNGTLDEVKRMIRAHYLVGGEWTSGDIATFESAGSPEPCYFTNMIDLFGAA